MPNISHIANLWTLYAHPSKAKEWSLEKKIKAVADAGFDGFITSLTPEHKRLAEKYKLKDLVGGISSANPDDFPKLLQAQKDAGAVQINVQMDDHDTPPALAAKHWITLHRAAEKIGGIVPSLEVHRDCCTETPEKTYEIAERFHKATGQLIKINFDFSHFALVKHLHPGNYVSRLLDHPDLIQLTEQVHFRAFNGHHCQVPILHKGELTPEAKSYIPFVQAYLALWKAAPHNKDKTLFACPEMGPAHADGGGYNITGLPPAWPDAIALRAEIAKAWKRAK